MSWFLNFVSVALYAAFIQNLVFNGGYGASESIRMSLKYGRVIPFSLMIAGYSTFTAVVCRALDLYHGINALSFASHAAIFGGVLAFSFLIIAAFLRLVFHVKKKTLSTMGVAALNSMVFAIPLINHRSGAGFAESIGMGIGSGVAFVFAVLLIYVGIEKIQKIKNIPKAFNGIPAIFIYVALISMAFSGLSGSILFV
ncbi:MAG: hypothetical protein K5756_05265 [Clostridiales bacterium]|nr:hypothetical protein [Clostridiales bacterium]